MTSVTPMATASIWFLRVASDWPQFVGIGDYFSNNRRLPWRTWTAAAGRTRLRVLFSMPNFLLLFVQIWRRTDIRSIGSQGSRSLPHLFHKDFGRHSQTSRLTHSRPEAKCWRWHSLSRMMTSMPWESSPCCIQLMGMSCVEIGCWKTVEKKGNVEQNMISCFEEKSRSKHEVSSKLNAVSRFDIR